MQHAGMPTATAIRIDAERFQHDGYLLPDGPVFPDVDFRALQERFAGLLADWTAKGGRPEAMDVPHFYDPGLMRWLLHPAVLDLVEPLLGPDILLFSSHFICKPAGDGKRVPWHEDSAYWKGLWEPMDVVTIWLAIDRSDLDNGCMHVIPGSHRNGYSTYAPVEGAVFGTEIAPGTFDPSTAVPCILPEGWCSLHHAKMIHGSAANRSPRRRCGYTMRFISAAARFTPRRANDDAFQIYLARGRNLAGNVLADPAQPNHGWIGRFGHQPPKGH